MSLKDRVRRLLNLLHLDLTKNLKYDRLTNVILKRMLTASSNCIDIGCHKGEILDLMLHLAPSGRHFGFEPLPYLYQNLVEKYDGRVQLFPYALSDAPGTSSFQFVKNAPAYSGLKKRTYAIANPQIDEIQVETKTLDETIPPDLPIELIKIDVEGGEFNVLKGARALLARWKPVVIFECGIGASDYYGTDPAELYHFLTEQGLHISLLKAYVSGKTPLDENAFVQCYMSNSEYYFIAHSLDN